MTKTMSLKLEAMTFHDINDNIERDIKPKTLDHKKYDVFDAVFRKSNDYWKRISEKMSDSEYEAWVINYVSSDQSFI